jgi:hypothetical protein
MKTLATLAVATLLAVGTGVAVAADARLKDLVIDHPWARATPPGAKSGGAFLTIENRGATPDKLVDAATPAAKFVEIHEMSMEGGMMKMRAVPGVEIKPGAKAELKPGGFHVMLFDLKQPLKAGDAFPLTLVFEKAGKVEVSVVVEDRGATGEPARH